VGGVATDYTDKDGFVFICVIRGLNSRMNLQAGFQYDENIEKKKRTR